MEKITSKCKYTLVYELTGDIHSGSSISVVAALERIAQHVLAATPAHHHVYITRIQNGFQVYREVELGTRKKRRIEKILLYTATVVPLTA